MFQTEVMSQLPRLQLYERQTPTHRTYGYTTCSLIYQNTGYDIINTEPYSMSSIQTEPNFRFDFRQYCHKSQPSAQAALFLKHIH